MDFNTMSCLVFAYRSYLPRMAFAHIILFLARNAGAPDEVSQFDADLKKIGSQTPGVFPNFRKT